MKIERVYTDGNGKRFRAVVEIDESGSALERAILRLANKARCASTGKVTALDGAVRVSVAEAASVPVCPRCLDIEPGTPGGTPEQPHHGPFRNDLCSPCEQNSGS
jgi:hypothetical protein